MALSFTKVLKSVSISSLQSRSHHNVIFEGKLRNLGITVLGYSTHSDSCIKVGSRLSSGQGMVIIGYPSGLRYGVNLEVNEKMIRGRILWLPRLF